MPGFSGLEALRLLRASGLDVPFIIISGSVDEADVAAALLAGATDFLWKDRMSQISQTVAQVLARRGASAGAGLPPG